MFRTRPAIITAQRPREVSAGSARRHNSLVVLVMCVWTWAAGATDDSVAQELQFARQRGPYFVGEPVVVQVVASGFQAGEEPTCRLTGDAPDGVTVQGPQVSQSAQSFTQIINGRVTHSETIDYRFSFVVTAQREGAYEIGPFEVTFAGQTRTVAGAAFEFGQLESDPDMQIELAVEDHSVYVGQEVPVTVRWSFAGEIEEVQYAFDNLQIRSPLFDQFTFRAPERRGRTSLTIATAKGSLEVDAAVTQEERDGRKFVVVSGTLTLVPDTPGTYDAIPITCRTKRVAQWGRDLFGGLTARGTAPARAAGTPLDLEVKPVPLDGRPASFSGAVGRGFTLEVSANRSVVRVGDPISLTVTVQGAGALDNVSLPDLAANVGFSSELFQLPAEPVAGTISGASKQFKVPVRVKDPGVTQIPPLAFAWFDPDQEQFQTTQSKPIALQVMAAQVISAADVVSAQPARVPDTAGNGAPEARESGPEPGGTFVGANLAIERDVARLLASADGGASRHALAGAVYGAAIAVVLVSVVLRRRAQRDPRQVQRRHRLRAARKQIAGTARQRPREAAAAIARCLRELLAQGDLAHRDEADMIIAQCDSISYATTEDELSPRSDLVGRALTLVDQAARPS
ncbi:MAG: BatD family protein [Pirellulaceae bacterium]|jgi:hypothetical protein|nr:BatD family protein [Pirellulaceae bacterium]